MSELNTSVPFLRAKLQEAILDLTVRPRRPLQEIMRDSYFAETLLLLLERVGELEAKVGELEKDVQPIS